MRTTTYALLLSAGLFMTACNGDTASEDTSVEADADTDSDSDSDSDSDTDTDTDTDTDVYVFATDAPAAYSRVDRAGMPAINTAVITSKDAYNLASPTDDANGDFVAEIVGALEFLHGALDDDLTGLGLTPCAVDDCVAQAAPLVVPDTLQIDINGAAAFPNGRVLRDPVIDITLGLVLLDLSVHPVDTLVGVGPTENDVPFQDGFPYLADPH